MAVDELLRVGRGAAVSEEEQAHRLVDEVSDLRERIDRVDEQILALVGQRWALVRDIAVAKRRVLQHSMFDQGREEEIVARLGGLAATAGSLSVGEARRLARAVIDACRSAIG